MAEQINDKLRVLVEAEVERAIRDLQRFDDTLDKSEKSAGNLGKALEAMEKKALVMSGIISGAGIAAIKFAGENEKLKVSLENLLGSAEEANRVFKDWRELGSSPGLSVAEVESAGKALLALGEDADYATRVMTRLGNVAAGTGASFSAVSDSYEKVRAQGKLSERDLNQFQRQGIPIVKALADVLNKSEEEVKSLVAAGQVGFPEMERAFGSLTEAGGRFEGALDKLSGTTLEKFGSTIDAGKQAMASFGELLLPMVNDILDSANSLFESISNMDDGAKRFVLGFGGVVAISGPAIAAIKGIGVAMTAVMANPWMLAIGGIVTAAGAVAGHVNKQAHAYKDLNNQLHKTRTEADSILKAFSEGNSAKMLDAEATQNLIKLYPKLAGEIEAYRHTVEDAAGAVRRLTKDEAINAAQKQIEKLRKLEDAVQDATAAYGSNMAKSQRNVAEAVSIGDLGAAQNFRDAVGVYEDSWNKAIEKAGSARQQINEELARVGLTLSGLSIVEMPDIPIPEPERTFRPPSGSTGNLKKTWQDWYSEITKVDLKAISMEDQGEALGQLFIDSLANTRTMNENLAEVLGNKFDVAGTLRSQHGEIERALRELLSISPSEINDPFTFKDKFIDPLAAQFKELDQKIKNLDALKTIEELDKKIKDFGKEEWELAKQAALDKGFSDEHAAEIERLTKEYAELTGAVKDFEKLAKDTFKNLALDIANITFDGILTGLSDVGAAFAKGENSAESFRKAMGEMSMAILESLPQMFLQAGLRLIIEGQWALGLGFIAAAGSTAFIGGFTKGYIEKEKEAATPNAHGNVFDRELVAFARGGAFTNQIVNEPTYFKYGGKFGVMGEAGPEAVMPLKRMPGGNLGIEASGGGTQVVVNIINNSGEPVTQEETTDADGNIQWDVIIGGAVNNHLASGKADPIMGARFGLRAQGV